MCRYAYKNYKTHFVCFACRKQFKKASLDDWAAQHGDEHLLKGLYELHREPEASRKRWGTTLKELTERYVEELGGCPECRGRMARMGLDFRPPKRTDTEAWWILEQLYEHGYAFTGCGCSVGYAPPARRADVPAFLAASGRSSEGERLLASIAARSSG